MVADDAGNAYMTGLTRATGFPTTAGAYDTTFNAGGGLFSSNGASAFVTKFGASGSMSYSTFLGTTTYYEMDIGIDSGRNAVAMGLTYDRAFPTTPGAFDPTNGPDGSDLFVAKLNASGSALSYSTYLGVGNEERPGAMAIDSDGNAIVRGFTLSDTYPTTPGAYDSTFNSFSTQAFVTKLDLLPTFFAFGNASVGGSFSPLSANTKRASPFTLFRNATIRRVYAYIDGKGATSGQQTLRAVVYRNAGGPAARAALSFDFTVKAGDPGHWQPFYLAPPVALGPGVYWLALQGGSADGVARVAWSSKPNSRRFNADSFGDGPSDPTAPPPPTNNNSRSTRPNSRRRSVTTAHSSSRPRLPASGSLLLGLALAASVALGLVLARNQADPAAGGAQHTPGAPALAKLPLSFVPNRGQVDGPARFYAQGPGYSFGFTRQGLALNLERGQRGIALKLGFLERTHHATRSKLSTTRQGQLHRRLGRHAATGLPTFGVIRYQELWPGIDMVVRGRGGTLKYEFHVRPGADSSDIGLAYSGAQSLALGADGGLPRPDRARSPPRQAAGHLPARRREASARAQQLRDARRLRLRLRPGPPRPRPAADHRPRSRLLDVHRRPGLRADRDSG